MSDARQFRLLAAGSWISQLGNGVTGLTVLLALGQWSEHPAGLIAGYAVASVLPHALFGVLAGAAADRFDRKRLMVGADLIRAVVVASMVLAGPGRLWVLVVGSFVVATVGAFSSPAASAMVPAVVGEDGVARAQATLMAGSNVFRVAGLGVASVLFAGGSLRLGFLVDAATFVAAAACKSRLRARPPSRGQVPEPFLRLVADGLVHLRSSRGFAAVVVVSAASSLAGAVLHVLWVPFALGSLRAAPGWLAVLEGAGVVGLVGGGLVLRRRPDPGPSLVFSGLSACGVALCLFALASHVSVLVPLEVMVGVGQVMTVTGSQCLLVQAIPAELRGRAFGALGAVTETCSVLSLVVVGVLADAAPARMLFAGTGIALLACALAAARLARDPAIVAVGQESPVGLPA